MNKEKVLQPALRFKGFEGDWESKNLGKCANFSKGKGFTKNDLSSSGMPIILYGRLYTNYEIAISKVDTFTNVDTSTALKSKGNEVIVPSSGETPEDIARASAVLQKGAILGGDLNIIYPDKKLTPIFLAMVLSNGCRQKELSKKAQGKSVVHIRNVDLKELDIAIPEFDEQIKINDFSLYINRQLKLHQTKHTKLQQLKKAMLSKMFPKEGETVPEIRFAGFSGDWDLKTLGEVAFKVVEKNHLKKEIETFTNSAEFGIIPQNKYFDKSISNIENIGGYFIVEPDSFVYNPRISASAPVGPINRNKLKKTGVVSPLYTVFKANTLNSSFLEYYFKSECWHAFMFLNGDTGARADRFSIKDSVFFELPTSFPKNLEEQTKIGNYFQNLDRLIALQQQQIDKLQNIKKALLEKMFV